MRFASSPDPDGGHVRVRAATLARWAPIAALAVLLAVGAIVIGTGKATRANGAAGSGASSSLPAAKAKTFYVSPSGSDANRGTAKKPWKTIQRALNTLRPGQKALVRRGTYGRVRCESGKGGSAAGGYVTLRAAPGRRPVITAAADGIVSINCDYLRIQGFVIAGPAVVGGTDIYGLSGTDHVQIVGNEIRNSVCQGMFLEEETDNWLIARNWIHDNGHGCDQQAHGIYLQGDGHVVANNLIDNQPEGYGIQAYDYNRGVRIVNNTIAHSGRGGIVVGGTGCRSGGGCGVADILIANNILAYNFTYGIAKNTDSPGSCDIHSNLAFGNGATPFATGWPAACLGSNLIVDPLFVDPARRNYHLRASSPAVDAGAADAAVSPDLDGRKRPRGAGPDIGAYER